MFPKIKNNNYISTPLFLIGNIIFCFLICCTKNTTVLDETTRQADSLSLYYKNYIKKLPPTSASVKIIDSFIEQANTLQLDTLVYKGYMRKIILLGRNKKYPDAINNSKLLLNIAKKNNDSSYMGKSYYKLGNYYSILGSYIKAFDYYNTSFTIHRNLKDSVLAGRRLLAMANMQVVLGDHLASNATAIEGLKYSNNLSDIETRIGLYQNISISYIELKDYNNATFWNTKAMTLAQKKPHINYNLVYELKNTKALILADSKHYSHSLSIFNNLLQDTVIIQDVLKYARVLNNYGYIHWKQNKHNTQSETAFLKALKIIKKKNDFISLVSINTHLANYYLETDKKKAFFYAQEAYKNAKKIKNKVEVLAALDLITAIDTTAIKELQEHKTISKFLEETRKEIRQIYAPTRFENEKLTLETLEKTRQIQKEKKEKVKTILWTIIIAVLILVAIAIYFIQRHKIQEEKNKREKLQAKIDAENKMSKRVHDSIANDIHFIGMLVKDNRDEVEILDKLNTVYNKARDIARDGTDIDFTKYTAYLKERIDSYISNNTNVFHKGVNTVNWTEISESKKLAIYTIIKELMVNMQKYSKADIVSVIFKKDKNTLFITYTDNGVGLFSKKIKKRNGIQIMENLTHSIGGTINFDLDREKGTKIKMQIPIHN